MPTLDTVDTGSAEDEEWRPVPGYPWYEVSDLGRVRSLDSFRLVKAPHRKNVYTLPIKGKILQPKPGTNGYLHVSIHHVNGKFTACVHRLVLLTFVGPRPEGMESRHLDGNQQNNRLTNLRYGTRQENIEDKLKHGRIPRGAASNHAKLTASAVLDIREACRKGTMQKTLALAYGVTESTICRIVQRKTWKHVGT